MPDETEGRTADRPARDRAGWRERMLAYVDALYDAVQDRDEPEVRALLAQGDATHLPREVREEALALLPEPVGSLRAPIRLLRFEFVLTQLDEHEELMRDRRSAEQLRLDLGLDVEDASGRGAVRWRQETAAARPARDEDGRPRGRPSS